MIIRESRVNGIAGIWNGGKLPSIEAKSPTDLVSKLKNHTIPNINNIDTKDEGMVLVNLGKPHIINMVINTKPMKEYSAIPVNQFPEKVQTKEEIKEDC